VTAESHDPDFAAAGRSPTPTVTASRLHPHKGEGFPTTATAEADPRLASRAEQAESLNRRVQNRNRHA
jgi:hypothetical protein